MIPIFTQISGHETLQTPLSQPSLTDQRSQPAALSSLDTEQNQDELDQGPHGENSPQSEADAVVPPSLQVGVMLKTQASHDLQYIALPGEGGVKGGETEANPLLASRLSCSPEPDGERGRPGDPRFVQISVVSVGSSQQHGLPTALKADEERAVMSL